VANLPEKDSKVRVRVLGRFIDLFSFIGNSIGSSNSHTPKPVRGLYEGQDFIRAV
jgi:hypothetical protein